MAYRRLAWLTACFAATLFAAAPYAQTPPNNTVTGKTNGADFELVNKLIKARNEYQKTLEQLRTLYLQVQDKEKERWAKEELEAFQRIPKHAFILELDVPNPKLPGDQNITEANRLLTWALQFKRTSSYGTAYIDNQRRAEILFQDLITRFPQSDKISDAAFYLGEIYEGKAYQQYYRAVEYYQRCYQWNPKTTLEARIKAARLYDQKLNNRAKALELYREITTHETDPARMLEAERRIAELSGKR